MKWFSCLCLKLASPKALLWHFYKIILYIDQLHPLIIAFFTTEVLSFISVDQWFFQMSLSFWGYCPSAPFWGSAIFGENEVKWLRFQETSTFWHCTIWSTNNFMMMMYEYFFFKCTQNFLWKGLLKSFQIDNHCRTIYKPIRTEYSPFGCIVHKRVLRMGQWHIQFQFYS